jgi:uncharacterized membrane protein YqaE (UPF0057 family)
MPWYPGEACPSNPIPESPMNILRIILAILLPPVAAYLQVNLTMHFWINIVLTLLGGIPGVLHALWLVVTDQSG